MTNLEKRVRSYKSREALKSDSPALYIRATKANVLNKAFPLPKPSKKPSRGIYKIYLNIREPLVHYIGYSLTDVEKAYKDKVEEIGNVGKVVYYKVHSSHDILVLYHYMVGNLKPLSNTEVYPQLLTVRIPGFSKTIGKGIKIQISS